MLVTVEVMEPFTLGRGALFASGERLRLDDENPVHQIAFTRHWVRRVERRAIPTPPVDRMVQEPAADRMLSAPVVAKAPAPVVADTTGRASDRRTKRKWRR